MQINSFEKNNHLCESLKLAAITQHLLSADKLAVAMINYLLPRTNIKSFHLQI